MSVIIINIFLNVSSSSLHNSLKYHHVFWFVFQWFLYFTFQHIFKYLQAEAVKKEKHDFLTGWKGFFKMVRCFTFGILNYTHSHFHGCFLLKLEHLYQLLLIFCELCVAERGSSKQWQRLWSICVTGKTAAIIYRWRQGTVFLLLKLYLHIKVFCRFWEKTYMKQT